MQPNDIQISPHFKLSEFADKSYDNLVVINPLLIQRLERLRCDLSVDLHADIAIIITSGTRTNRTNRRLANVLGWTHEGGAVAPDSKHLPRFGGIAADLFALNNSTGAIVSQTILAHTARPLFDVVLDHYPTHIHVDLRHSPQSEDLTNDH